MAVTLVASLSGCSTVKMAMAGKVEPPTVEFAQAGLTGVSFTDATFKFDLHIENPNPVGAKIASVEYALAVDDSIVAQGEQTDGLALPANGSTDISLPLTVEYAPLLKSLVGAATNSEAVWRFETIVAFDVPVVGRVRIPVSRVGKLPLVRMPTIRLAAVALLGGARRGLLGVEVVNPNAFLVRPTGLQFTLEVGGKEWATSRVSPEIEVFGERSGAFDVPFEIDYLKIGGTALQALFGKGELDYTLRGSMIFETPLPLMAETQMPFNVAGTAPMRDNIPIR